MDIHDLKLRLRQFATDRNWEQFHSPKNLSMALAVEAGELLERFLWLSDEDSHQLRQRPDDFVAVSDELADVFIYLLRLADRLEIDIEAVVEAKIRKNEQKYPVHLAYGNAVKYNRRATSECLSPEGAHDTALPDD